MENRIVTDVYPSDEPDSDRLHRLVRASLGALPVGSGTAVELFNAIITPPLDKRKKRWIKEVTEALNELLSRSHLTVEELSNNGEFIDVLISSSAQAIKTSEKEKIQILKNAVQNSAQREILGNEYRQHVLLLLDTLSVTHIRVLKCFSGVHAGLNEGEAILKDYMSDWDEHEHLYLQSFRELVSRGLIIDRECVTHGRQ
ncbi:MAG: hypothetical protein LPD71_12580 [Shewanella sp.]|nr:hypothetical protein [Shewanella sp.]